jgi:hypothetical protein
MRRFLWTYGVFGWLWYVAAKRLWCACMGHEEVMVHNSGSDCNAVSCDLAHNRGCSRCGSIAIYPEPKIIRYMEMFIYEKDLP